MPYTANSDLPENIKSVLPGAAQSIFRKVFNKAIADGKDEDYARKVAWTAVKNAGFKKQESGKWERETPAKIREALNPNKSTAMLRKAVEGDLGKCVDCLFYNPPYDWVPAESDDPAKAWCVALLADVDDNDVCDIVHPVVSSLEAVRIFNGPGSRLLQVRVDGKCRSLVVDDFFVEAYRGSFQNKDGRTYAYFSCSDGGMDYTLSRISESMKAHFIQEFTVPIDLTYEGVRLKAGETMVEVRVDA